MFFGKRDHVHFSDFLLACQQGNMPLIDSILSSKKVDPSQQYVYLQEHHHLLTFFLLISAPPYESPSNVIFQPTTYLREKQ